MSKHFAKAVWNGNLKDGNGKYTLRSSGFEDAYTFNSRFEDGKKSSPEELIGAALAACFSMALANDLNKDGTNPESIETEAEVILKNTGAGFNITEITLTTKGRVKGIDQGKFVEAAEKTKENCPVGKALKAVEIKVDAELIGS
ncbi:MAG: OsmC family peroxiredoxin [Bacteroidales bacterium]|nr:OsmC family peroxiredoxin [Bacteroidales bacterium]